MPFIYSNLLNKHLLYIALGSIGLTTLVNSGFTYAEIYKWRDSSGVTQYSDKAPASTEKTSRSEIMDALQTKEICRTPEAANNKKIASKYQINFFGFNNPNGIGFMGKPTSRPSNISNIGIGNLLNPTRPTAGSAPTNVVAAKPPSWLGLPVRPTVANPRNTGPRFAGLNPTSFFNNGNKVVTVFGRPFNVAGVKPPSKPPVPTPTPTPTPSCVQPAYPTTGYSQVFKGCDANYVATYYAKDECVRDNATGLIWQGQTPAGTGLRANDQYKTNYDSTTALQKWKGTWSGLNGSLDTTLDFVAPTSAEVNATTNSIGYKNAVNATNLCGSGAWRLPTKDELLGIVKITEYPTIDNTWFPNTVDWIYWTSSPYVGYAYRVWVVLFDQGLAYDGYRDYNDGNGGSLVRLVR